MTSPRDVEALIVAYLDPLLAAKVSTRIPNPRPVELVRVQRIGGTRQNIVQERPLILVECWGASSVSAFTLASQVWGLLDALDDTTAQDAWFHAAELSSPVSLPDPSTASPRYQFTASMVVHLTKEPA